MRHLHVYDTNEGNPHGNLHPLLEFAMSYKEEKNMTVK